MTMLDRLQKFEACFNFRDLGGYETRDGRRVRWNLVYRADSLHRFSAADLERFGRLNVQTVIDLRAEDEIEDFGRLASGLPGVEWHHRPLVESMRLRGDPQELPAGEEQATQAPGEGYFDFVRSGDMATSILSLISRSEGAAVFHCTSGKDRTGVIAAMLLDLLGVPDETIAEDYVLTQASRKRAAVWIEENEPDFASFLAKIPADRRLIRPEAILGFLARVREAHGSVADLLRARGMSQKSLDGITSKLLI
jgi:protein-tyrosine phosphatase